MLDVAFREASALDVKPLNSPEVVVDDRVLPVDPTVDRERAPEASVPRADPVTLDRPPSVAPLERPLELTVDRVGAKRDPPAEGDANRGPDVEPRVAPRPLVLSPLERPPEVGAKRAPPPAPKLRPPDEVALGVERDEKPEPPEGAKRAPDEPLKDRPDEAPEPDENERPDDGADLDTEPPLAPRLEMERPPELGDENDRPPPPELPRLPDEAPELPREPRCAWTTGANTNAVMTKARNTARCIDCLISAPHPP